MVNEIGGLIELGIKSYFLVKLYCNDGDILRIGTGSEDFSMDSVIILENGFMIDDGVTASWFNYNNIKQIDLLGKK